MKTDYADFVQIIIISKKTWFEGGYSILLPQTEKSGFFRPPEASNGRMIKSFEMRSVQVNSSKPQMLNYACGEHALTKSEKMLKNVFFSPEIPRFLGIFHF